MRPGGRTARTRQLVLDAALAEVSESGYAGVSIERIAKRAGVAPSTVYRRWRTVENVVLDIADKIATEHIELAPSQDLESDLRALTRGIVTLYRVPVHRTWMDVMVSSAVREERARDTLHQTLMSRIATTSAMVERAILRGEVPPDTDTEEVVRVAAAPLYYRMYITCEEIDEEIADRCARMAALAARNGILTKR
ncbi:TetR/AcrR family transcriptional regulator [Actinocorallia longicatena]|uniref:TetR/AcrR family transcriptional regulator n=1 Tax=Actinocorallia longicatena TaxID=111803 RepID=UPI0031DCE60C